MIPWWLQLPQGVSGAIKRRAGLEPFRELGRHGPIRLGDAVHTGPGRLPYRGIIHVASIDLPWRASERSITDSVRSAIALGREHGYGQLAMPIIGAGSGGVNEARALEWIARTVRESQEPGSITVVRFRPTKA